MPTGPPVVIIAPTIIRYTFKHQSGSGQKFDNVVDISVESAGVNSRSTVRDDFNTKVNGFWQDSLLSFYPTSTTFQGSHWIDLDSAGGSTGELAPVGGKPTAGNMTGPFLPPNCAFLVSKVTAHARGQKSGRLYVGQPRESDADDTGLVSTGQKNAITSAGGNFVAAIGGYTSPSVLGVNPCGVRVVHVHKPNKVDSTTWTWSSSTVTAMVCDAKIATQRRRLR